MALGGLDSAISVARSMRLAKHSEGLLANPIICGSRVECSDKKERKKEKQTPPAFAVLRMFQKRIDGVKTPFLAGGAWDDRAIWQHDYDTRP